MLLMNLHYSVPRIPHIRSIECFKGRKIHSHDYREPFLYKDDTVVILGAAASGLDICLEISRVARKVFLSHNQPVNHPSEFPANVEQVRGVVEATEKGFNLMDGSHIEADVIMFCTGYDFSFPFLTKDCGITVEDNVVKPLYKHLIHSAYPSMAFIGIPFLVCPFPLFDFQAQHYLATLTGHLKLPSSEEMAAVTSEEMNQKNEEGIPVRHYHKIGMGGQRKYMEEVVKETGCTAPKPYVFTLLTTVFIRLILDAAHFKEFRYRVQPDGSFDEFRNGRLVRTKLDMFCLVIKRTLQMTFSDFCRVTTFIVGMIFRRLNRMFKPNPLEH
ncbi:uncharacterized protein [Macrobrachium rosenbergii]|uniref:uncharacterized protein isoform X2 n=1 Tax=Macrobrachium rosenbergii TaxID=79674 RepID=UPI0034D642AA